MLVQTLATGPVQSWSLMQPMDAPLLETLAADATAKLEQLRHSNDLKVLHRK